VVKISLKYLILKLINKIVIINYIKENLFMKKIMILLKIMREEITS
jgi:hypothetical protein